ncbi:hypothetical protein AVEN_61577-1 [Araneus ventricosus]|uniref:Uncharacterized protein n=1 Tax=Araneus ventricosus TaxID=182803 RepID=A0A4Y2SFW9_ARAVE|nr:hypothetical protein AVEN_61577-1 [Araneus ventricosus]
MNRVPLRWRYLLLKAGGAWDRNILTCDSVYGLQRWSKPLNNYTDLHFVCPPHPQHVTLVSNHKKMGRRRKKVAFGFCWKRKGKRINCPALVKGRADKIVRSAPYHFIISFLLSLISLQDHAERQTIFQHLDISRGGIIAEDGLRGWGGGGLRHSRQKEISPRSICAAVISVVPSIDQGTKTRQIRPSPASNKAPSGSYPSLRPRAIIARMMRPAIRSW